MTSLEWNKAGERYFETGVDRGVLYVGDEIGVPWNGLTSVKDGPIGGSQRAYYQEGRKYLNRSESEEFGGSIAAYTYPDEFEKCDGIAQTEYGFAVHQQKREEFGLSYRTLVGNDIQSSAHAYKIHLIYNCLVSPPDKTYNSIGDQIDPLVFAWEFTTTPIDFAGYAPVSHITIDSRGFKRSTMAYLEAYLYGSGSGSAHLPTPQELIDILKESDSSWQIVPNSVTGFNMLIQGQYEDLDGAADGGLFRKTPQSRLVPTSTPGFSTFTE